MIYLRWNMPENTSDRIKHKTTQRWDPEVRTEKDVQCTPWIVIDYWLNTVFPFYDCHKNLIIIGTNSYMRMAGRQPNGMFNLRGNSEYFANNFLRNIKWRWWSFLRAPYQYEYQKYQIVDKEQTWEPEDFPPRQLRSTCTPNSPNCQNHACKGLSKL